MHKTIRLKDDSIHIVQSVEDFLSLVEDVMGVDSKKFIEEELVVEDETEYYKDLLEQIRDLTYGC